MRALLGRRENPNSPTWPRATCHRERDKIRPEIGRPCAPRLPFSDGRLAGPAAFLPRPLAGPGAFGDEFLLVGQLSLYPPPAASLCEPFASSEPSAETVTSLPGSVPSCFRMRSNAPLIILLSSAGEPPTFSSRIPAEGDRLVSASTATTPTMRHPRVALPYWRGPPPLSVRVLCGCSWIAWHGIRPRTP